MGTEFYLDTARLGRMCPGARLAEQEFGRLVSRLGSSLYLERFLAHGFRSLPAGYRRRAPNLKCWRGVAGLRQGLADFVGQPDDCPSHFFGQSSAMLRFAAECLFARANRVLITDMAWPAYVEALKSVAALQEKSVCTLPIRDKLFGTHMTAADVVEHFTEAFAHHDCDGVFLSDINYLGVRLPAEEILRQLGNQCRFSVIDGAQAINQRPVDLSQLGCDLYLAGTQKWFCSYHPLRIALVGKRSSAELIGRIAKHTAHSDSLFDFCRALQGNSNSSYGETVNVSALIVAAGSLRQMTYRTTSRQSRWERLTQNTTTLGQWLEQTSFSPLIRSASLRSGIVLARSRCSSVESQPDRSSLAKHGLIASPFPGGLVRLSMPAVRLSPRQMATISRALNQLAL